MPRKQNRPLLNTIINSKKKNPSDNLMKGDYLYVRKKRTYLNLIVFVFSATPFRIPFCVPWLCGSQ